MEEQYLQNIGTGVVSNLIFVVAYLLSICLKKRHKHSHCKTCCFEMDIEDSSDDVENEV